VKSSDQDFFDHERVFELIDKIKSKPWHWLSLSAVLVAFDYATGSVIQFPLLHVIPVSLAAWSGRRGHAYALAVILPATRVVLNYAWHVHQTPFDIGINFIIRGVTLAGLVYLLLFLQSMRFLRGLLPICAWCKRIRDEQGDWSAVESYVQAHSEAEFTHGICPDCVEKVHTRVSAVTREH
jgi:hypothetical protein